MRRAILLLTVLLPWRVRRTVLNRIPGFEIDPDASIGLSLVAPRRLKMGPGSRIGHFNVIHGIESLDMEEQTLIGGFNWISANLGDYTNPEVEGREPRLVLRRFSGITTRHYLDCSDRIEIGEFALLAGLRSVLLTHHMDMDTGRQGCAPIGIGAHSFVGTNCVLLGGAALPARSILAAGSVLVDRPGVELRLYAGSPAREKKSYEDGTGWFARTAEEVSRLRRRWSS